METGSSQQILASPRHPYTQALIAATPEFGSHYTTQRMASIPGQVSGPTRPLPGCPFQPRCQFAKEECRQTTDCWRMEE